MSTRNASRRDFLKITGAGVAGAALSTSASSYARILGANDRVGVGIVGFSDRVRSSLIPAFAKVSGGLNFELVALSDQQRIDEVVVTYFAKPHSYTTDDIVVQFDTKEAPSTVAYTRDTKLIEPLFKKARSKSSKDEASRIREIWKTSPPVFPPKE